MSLLLGQRRVSLTGFKAWFSWRSECENVRQLRCLVDETDEEGLGQWSTAVADNGEEILQSATGPVGYSWRLLMRRMSLLLLESVANSPQSAYAVSHLKVLRVLLSAAKTGALGANSSAHAALAKDIISDLLDYDLYTHLGHAIRSIPIEAYSSSAALPLLILLATSPFSILAPTSPSYQPSLTLFFVHILTIPLNRLPMESQTEFSSHLPLSSLDILSLSIPDIIASSPAPESRFNLIANLYEFTRPVYQTLSLSAFDVYLHFLTELMDAISISSFEFKQSLYQLDSHTKERLMTISGADHLASLLAASKRYRCSQWSLASFLLSLGTICPTRRENMLSTLLGCPGGDLVRELYREFVRASPLGRDYSPKTLMDPSFASAWPPLLLLSDLYSQSLLTMGDEEFSPTASNTTIVSRNPLALDELIDFSKKLQNIAYTLWFMEDQTNVQEGKAPGVNLKWVGVREKVTKCLQAIHERDSRKQFTPQGHWLVNSQIDMQSFIEAAVFEEAQQSQQSNDSGSLSKCQAALSPCLGVLNNIPFAIPVDVRVSIFQRFVNNDMSRDRSEATRLSVRRRNVAQDAFDNLARVDIKAPIEITIIDQSGQDEETGDGVFKEFFASFCEEVFSEDRGLWLANKKQELYPNPHSYATEQHSLEWYRFIGRIVGKAIYEGHSVFVQFAGFFLRKWLGKQESFLDDLQSLDPDLWQGLVNLKHCVDNPQDLSVNFAIAVEENETHDLIPNGSNVAVTRENRLQYIQLVSHYRLNEQIKLQSEAFFEGLLEVIDSRLFRMFNQQDIGILLGSAFLPIDLMDLRSHTNYDGYNGAELTINAFWKVVDSFDQEERRALLEFATSCRRPPLLGFKDLVPHFTVCHGGEDEQYLPTVSKCHNLLKLPRYTNEHVLHSKLLQAIRYDTGHPQSFTTGSSQHIIQFTIE